MPSELPKTFESQDHEAKLYAQWEASGKFAPAEETWSGKAPRSMMLPPPNATGTLHLGHATMLALQDILARYWRMQGHPTLWLPGTDHAGIATQSVVEKRLQDQGIEKPREALGREKLLEEIKKFVAGSKDTIRNQIRKMGASVDWSRERYTFSEDMNHAVNTLFKMMVEDRLIYRGDRLVNWDPKMQTTVADDELEYIEEKTPFYYFQFGPVVIGTARPETKFQDKVIVVHPEDARYKDLIGKTFEVDWIEGKIEAQVIADPCMDMELGTGAMTITPAHSLVDFDLAQKFKLEKPRIIGLDGKILAEVSKTCGGLSVKEARQKVVAILQEKGLVVKIDENYLHNVAVNYRGKGVVEPQIMKQWFVDVQKPAIDWKGNLMSMKEVLQDVVSSQMIRIVPDRFEKTYFHWINNLRDWCISRQIWWGHRIPVWYKGPETQVSELTPGEGWVQDEDTLDTWFSSGLWTFSTLGWPEKTPDLARFAPSEVLETGYDILFFWVARMILQSTYALRKSGIPEEKAIPFHNVYLHGLIRDINGKKMSKSRPETCIDPLDMIQKYGTDAIRLSLIIGGTPGNDMRLYEEKIAGYRNFVNKIWNGSRFVLMNLSEKEPHSSISSGLSKTLDSKTFNLADRWILSRLNHVVHTVTEQLESYQFSEAGMQVYDFFWSEFCDWYVETSKVNKNETVLEHVLTTVLKLLHPFMPFVTEAIWQERHPSTLLMTAPWPQSNAELHFAEEESQFQKVKDLITTIRSLRAEAGVDATKKIHAIVFAHGNLDLLQAHAEIIKRMANLGSLELFETGEKPEKALSSFVGSIEIYLPLKDLLNVEAEQARLKKEIAELERFVQVLETKLSNEGFLKKAPEAVVQTERAKQEECRQRIEKLKTQVQLLGE